MQADAKSPQLSWVLAVVAAAGWAGAFAVPGLWRILGVADFSQPFLDLHGSLAASDAAAQGLDPYPVNRLDLFGRPHLYSSWWFVFGRLGLTRSDVPWLGVVLLAGFLAAAVHRLAPRTWKEVGATAALLLSPAFLMAVHRANNDLMIFLLVAVVLVFVARGTAVLRVAAMALVGVGIVLKYYPAALLVLLVTAPSRRQLAAEVGAVGLVCVLGANSLGPALAATAKYWTSEDGFYSFGASHVWLLLGVSSAWRWGLVLLAVVAGGVAWRVWRSRLTVSAPTLECAAGCGLVCVCFALGQTYAYKLIFVVPMLPTLWRERAWVVGLGLLVAAWSDGIMALGLNLAGPALSGGVRENLIKYAPLAGAVAQWVVVAGALGWLARFIVVHGARWRRPAVKP
jgi:hypothetical protein